jgi:hypothetical protein
VWSSCARTPAKQCSPTVMFTQSPLIPDGDDELEPKLGETKGRRRQLRELIQRSARLLQIAEQRVGQLTRDAIGSEYAIPHLCGLRISSEPPIIEEVYIANLKSSAVGIILLGEMNGSMQRLAQYLEERHHKPKHHTYKLIDPGGGQDKHHPLGRYLCLGLRNARAAKPHRVIKLAPDEEHNGAPNRSYPRLFSHWA